jgi:Chaperone of endosialidase
MKTTTNIIYPAFALFACACFALCPQARATCRQGCSGDNTFLGDNALGSNTDGFFDTAVGYHALEFNTNGVDNTASGAGALLSNTAGNNNTASGFDALQLNTTGSNNTATGDAALELNTTGSGNIAFGNFAGVNLTTGDNNIDIGNEGVAGETGMIRIGTAGSQTATFIAGIRESPIAAGIAVGITVDGQLGVRASSARVKEAINPMDKASEAVLALKPVKFRYKKDLDPEGIPQFGLVAEEVEKVNPDLVARDDQGKAYTVRYEAVNAMLLNEFLKEHRKVQEQEATITQLNKDFRTTVTQLTARLDEQAAQIQKVSAQVELSKPAAQTAQTNR